MIPNMLTLFQWLLVDIQWSFANYSTVLGWALCCRPTCWRLVSRLGSSQILSVCGWEDLRILNKSISTIHRHAGLCSDLRTRAVFQKSPLEQHVEKEKSLAIATHKKQCCA